MLEELGALASLADGEVMIECCATAGPIAPQRPRRPTPAPPRDESGHEIAHAQAIAAQATSIDELGRALADGAAESLSLARELVAVSTSLLATIGAARGGGTVNASPALLSEVDRHAARLDCLGRRLTSKLHAQRSGNEALAARASTAWSAARALVDQIDHNRL